jgi:hypothetical protein
MCLVLNINIREYQILVTLFVWDLYDLILNRFREFGEYKTEFFSFYMLMLVFVLVLIQLKKTHDF